MKFLSSRTFITAALVIVAIALVAWWISARPEKVRYQTEAIDTGSITQNVSANGTLNPVTLVSVGTQVSGTILELFADYNDRVEKGQVLMQLDDALLRAALAQSEANFSAAQSALTLAKNEVSRIDPLAKEGFVSQQEQEKTQQALRDAEARVTQTRSQVEKDRTNLSYAIIRSPVSGVVVSRSVDAGQTVAASFNTPELFKIAQDLSEMQIDAYFAEADIGQIKVGQEAKFRVDAFQGQRFTGTVKQIRLNPKTESNVVTYNVVISVSNPDEKLLPGMTAYVDIAVQSRRNVLRVPNAALRFRPTRQDDVVETKTEEPKVAADAKAEEKPGKPDGAKGEQGNDEKSKDERSADAAKADGSSGATRRGPRGEGRGRGGMGGMGGASQAGNVYVLRNGKLHPVSLKAGITDRRYTELLSHELKEGDLVVVEEVIEGSTPTNTDQRGMRFGM